MERFERFILIRPESLRTFETIFAMQGIALFLCVTFLYNIILVTLARGYPAKVSLIRAEYWPTDVKEPKIVKS